MTREPRTGRPLAKRVAVVYSMDYGIHLGGLEKQHAFDINKYDHIYMALVKAGVLRAEDVFVPPPVTDEQLLLVHGFAYLRRLNRSPKEVAKALDVPVAGGEQDTDLAQFRRMIAMKAVDIVQPDVCYIGGFSRTLRVGKMAVEAGIPCLPHSANRSMVTVFTLHAMTVMPAAARYVEFSIEPDSWADEIFTPALTVKNGMIPFPAGPGWGVTIREDWLSSAERQVSEVK